MEEKIKASPQSVEQVETLQVFFIHPDPKCLKPTKPQKSTELTTTRSKALQIALPLAPTCGGCGVKLITDLRPKTK